MSDVRIGLIARADDRGLGTITWEFHNHLRPDKTLVVLTGNPDFPEHPGRYQHGTVTHARLGPDLSLSDVVVREFLSGLDVVYSAETFYDWRVLHWADEMGVKTVCHGMPELTVHARKRKMRQPDEWWWPTSWMLDQMPPGRVMPIPSNPQPIEPSDVHSTAPLRVVHPGGKMALADRDGTQTFLDALSMVTAEVDAWVYTQDRSFEDVALSDNVQLFTKGYVPDRWSIYRGMQLMVLPRRYGGLSLKVHESLDCGVPVILPRIEPNMEWPGPRFSAAKGRRILVPCGPLQTFDSNAAAIADEIDTLASNRALLETERQVALEWSNRNSWDRWGPEYEQAFEDLM